MNELNKKMNTWAGTEDVDYIDPEFGIAYCFKWLVPKVYKKQREFTSHGKIRLGYDRTDRNSWCCRLTMWDRGEQEFWGYTNDDNPALALCLAIEKLIGGR